MAAKKLNYRLPILTEDKLDDAQRALLHEMDNAIQRLNQTHADETARRSLIGCYHNLVRQWSQT